jgi:hypothetical protein
MNRPPMTQRERRTIRIAVIGIAIYLPFFIGFKVWKRLEATRTGYEQLLAEARSLKREFQPYEDRAQLIEKLKTNFKLDPLKLSRTTLVAEASAAIQRTAQTGGVQLGPIREASGRPTARELVSMQLEGMGPVPALMGFLHKIQTLGYPVIVESLQITADPTKPGMVKLNLTIIILDFDQWKKEERRNV